MFASLLQHQSDRPRSERTPLLAAFHRYRARNNADEDHSASGADDDDDDREDVERFDREDDHPRNRGRGRGGPLLPVFSEFLGMMPLFPIVYLFTDTDLSV